MCKCNVLISSNTLAAASSGDDGRTFAPIGMTGRGGKDRTAAPSKVLRFLPPRGRGWRGGPTPLRWSTSQVRGQRRESYFLLTQKRLQIRRPLTPLVDQCFASVPLATLSRKGRG